MEFSFTEGDLEQSLRNEDAEWSFSHSGPVRKCEEVLTGIMLPEGAHLSPRKQLSLLHRATY